MINGLKKALTDAEKIVLIGHKNPDGDATGATLAWKGVLEKQGKQVKVIYPTAMPPYLTWLAGADEAIVFEKKQEAAISALNWADFLMMIDFNGPSRVGDLAPFLPEKPMALIDHHPYPEFETKLLFSDTSVSSACELVTRIIYDMGWDTYIGKDEATALFVGMMTDTGRFSHNSSNPQTFRMVANLLEKGVDKDEVVDRVFDSFSESRTRLMGYLLNDKMQVFPKQKLAIMTLSLEDKERFCFQTGDSEGLVNIPLSIDGVNRSVFLQEYDDKIRMSFRSKGDDPVNHIASEHFEGGGHANAAGGTSYLSLDATVVKVKKAFGIE